MFYFFLVLAVVFAVIFTIRRGKKTDTVSLLLKVIASFCFILLGVSGFLLGKTYSMSLTLLVIIGLVCGLIGDIYLDMKFVYAQDDTIHTFTGFGAFMLGHIFYILFLFLCYGIHPLALIVAVAAGIVIGIAIYLTPKLMKLDYGRFRMISSIYAGILVFVTVYALMLEIAYGHTAAKLLFAVGLVLFLISDLILSQIYFGKDKNTTTNKILNHAAYYAAQILIASSIYFL